MYRLLARPHFCHGDPSWRFVRVDVQILTRIAVSKVVAPCVLRWFLHFFSQVFLGRPAYLCDRCLVPRNPCGELGWSTFAPLGYSGRCKSVAATPSRERAWSIALFSCVCCSRHAHFVVRGRRFASPLSLNRRTVLTSWCAPSPKCRTVVSLSLAGGLHLATWADPPKSGFGPLSSDSASAVHFPFDSGGFRSLEPLGPDLDPRIAILGPCPRTRPLYYIFLLTSVDFGPRACRVGGWVRWLIEVVGFVGGFAFLFPGLGLCITFSF